MQTAEPQPSQLIAISVGLPQEVLWRGQTIQTGIFKSPLDGRVQVGPHGTDDGQDHLFESIEGTVVDESIDVHVMRLLHDEEHTERPGVESFLREVVGALEIVETEAQRLESFLVGSEQLRLQSLRTRRVPPNS